jgi:hypothetical protein
VNGFTGRSVNNIQFSPANIPGASVPGPIPLLSVGGRSWYVAPSSQADFHQQI